MDPPSPPPLDPELLFDPEPLADPELPLDPELLPDPELAVEPELPLEPELPFELELASEPELAFEPEPPLEPVLIPESSPGERLLDESEDEHELRLAVVPMVTAAKSTGRRRVIGDVL